VTTDHRKQPTSAIGHPAHARCILCGQENPCGFNLEFHSRADGAVEGFFQDHDHCEGYAHMVHGGIIALLLDGAMTNCLFTHGRTGVTARMELWFRHPVRSDHGMTVRAWIERDSHPLYRLRAQLVQDDQIKATAKGVFMDRSDLNSSETIL